jgi:hypothetical protein
MRISQLAGAYRDRPVLRTPGAHRGGGTHARRLPAVREAARRLRFIKHAQELGYTLDEVQQTLAQALMAEGMELHVGTGTRGSRRARRPARVRNGGRLHAHVVAPNAGDIIGEAVLAVRFGLTTRDLASTLHAYLTWGEAIKLAAQTFTRDVAKLSCCA